MQTNKKSFQYLLTTQHLLIAALSPAPLDDCQSPKNLLYHIQDWRRGCTPFAAIDHSHRALQHLLGFQALSPLFQCRREDYKDKRPKLLPEVHIGKTKVTGHKTKQEISQLGIRKKSDHQNLEQSSTGCTETWMNLYLIGFS